MEHVEAIEGLLKLWRAKHGLVPGSRNANVFKLAAAFNNFGVPYSSALAVCLGFVDPNGPDPFTAPEITRAVENAYKYTEHGTKQWKPRPGARTVQAPTVPRSIPTPLPPPVNQVQAFIQRHHLERFVEAMELDLDRARMVPQPPRSARDNTGEIERRKG